MSEEIKEQEAAVAPEEAEATENKAEEVSEEKAEKTSKKKEKKSKEKEELENLKAEYEEFKKNHLRILAEYDNFRKRTANEKAGIFSDGVSETIKQLLPVADNIERALAVENADSDTMKKGIEMIAKQFEESFTKLNITAIGVVGESFDPEIHNAVSHIDNDELGDNVVSAVFMKGYRIGKKVIRHAMVQVAN
ncbi:MAG: nucleotide exchange factor GrpE [Clostridia bacterium]|nr:nucleotide exchange factor GrpE [Clostridia bacterium]